MDNSIFSEASYLSYVNLLKSIGISRLHFKLDILVQKVFKLSIRERMSVRDRREMIKNVKILKNKQTAMVLFESVQNLYKIGRKYDADFGILQYGDIVTNQPACDVQTFLDIVSFPDQVLKKTHIDLIYKYKAKYSLFY